MLEPLPNSYAMLFLDERMRNRLEADIDKLLDDNSAESWIGRAPWIASR